MLYRRIWRFKSYAQEDTGFNTINIYTKEMKTQVLYIGHTQAVNG